MSRSYKLLFPILMLASASAFAQVSLNYEVTPDPVTSTVHVKAELTGLEANSIPVIAIQSNYASVDDYYNEIEGLKLSHPKKRNIIPFKKDGVVVPYLWTIDSSLSGTSLIYEYTVKVTQTIPGKVTRFKPSMSADSYYSNGYPLFIYPDRYNLSSTELAVDTINVEFNLPSSWAAITSFQEMTGEFTPDDLDELLYSSVSMGAYRRVEKELPNGADLVLSITGDWNFTDEELAQTAGTIISEQINMMQSWGSDVYTVTLSQHDRDGSMSGSGLTNAFEMFAYPEVELDEFYFLLSHENFHYWNGHRIHYDHARNRWFSEGFTNYYTFLFISRPELWDLDVVLSEFSSTYQDYFHSPLSTTITFDDAARYFWDYREYSKHFYRKGMLMALMADVRIRAQSNNQKSLDGFMRLLDSKLNGSGMTLDNATFLREINAYTGSDWQDFMTANVVGTDWLQVNASIQQGGMELVDQDCERPYLGVTILPNFCNDGKACGYKATGVIVNGPAYVAGIRENDLILRKRIYRQPGAPATLVVDKPEGEKEIQFNTESQTLQCKNLTFVEHATQKQKEIRSSIWGQTGSLTDLQPSIPQSMKLKSNLLPEPAIMRK